MDAPAPEGSESTSASIAHAAEIIANAKALLITAGAGMGVDSGLPDFRGPEGFWRAYPAYRKLGLNFAALADPRHFRQDPALAWGFYGHRLNLYRATQPHDGFQILKRWGERMAGGYHVFTSNVDGQFQRAGFDEARITEVHGSIHHFQCCNGCGIGIFPTDAVEVDVDENTMRARGKLPTCPACGGLARPNILMFGDSQWDTSRSIAQEQRLTEWLWLQRRHHVQARKERPVPWTRDERQSVALTSGAKGRCKDASAKPPTLLPMQVEAHFRTRPQAHLRV